MPHLLVMAFCTVPDPDILAAPGAVSALRLGRRILLRGTWTDQSHPGGRGARLDGWVRASGCRCGWWLGAPLAGAVTVPGSGNRGRWRVVIKVVHYQAQRMLFVFGPDDLRYLISGPAGHGSAGMLVVMAGLAGTGQPAAGYAAAAGTVLVLLAAAAFAVTRAILRPLREAARLTADAGHGGGGRPGDVMASLGVLADRHGMTAARMRQRLQASHA